MTMAAFQDADAKLLEDGFFVARDATLGEDIAEMERRQYPAEFGLEFCERHVLSERICSVARTFFQPDECVLAHWLRYEKYPGHNLCFRRGGPRAGRRRLLVHLLSRGSKVAYWKHAHKHDMPTATGLKLLYEIEESDLLAAGCGRVEEEFVDGGIAVLDARVAFELKEGYAITFEFATIDIMEQPDRWPKMMLPNTPALVEKVAAMHLPGIRLNFAFKDAATEDSRHEPAS